MITDRKCRAVNMAHAAVGMRVICPIVVSRFGDRGGTMITIGVMARMILFGWRGLVLAIRRDGGRCPRQGQGDQQENCE